jgi:hypothetical protein
MNCSHSISLINWLGVWFLTVSPGTAAESIDLREGFVPGYQYHVSTRTELSGTLKLLTDKDQATAKTLPVTGNSSIEYDERVLTIDHEENIQKTARIYRRIDFERQVGNQPQQNTIRPEVRRMVIQRQQPIEVPFSPDGPLTWGEIDLVRTDVFTPALIGLLPRKPVVVGDRWTAANSAIQELTDLERIEEGSVACRLDQLTLVEKRRHARIAFTGTVRGVNEDGRNRQELEGYFFFDLESNHLSYLYLKGISSLLDKDGKVVGRVEGRFILTRQAPQPCRELSDEGLRGVVLDPNADNTLLLYDSAESGLRFLYPRRWRVANVHGRQVALDEATGSGLLITLEPLERTPTGAHFLAETRGWLQKQNARELRVEQPRRVLGAANDLEQFALDVAMGGERLALVYYVSRQKHGGVTLAARLLAQDLPALTAEVDRIARSLIISRTIRSDLKK